MESIGALKGKLSYEFKDSRLLERVFVHGSYLNEPGAKGMESNERLEFLGDAVLSLVISALLYEKFPSIDEGELTGIRARLVNKKTLSTLAARLGLGECLLLGRGEELGGGRGNDSILADALEALIAAIYLDAGPQNGYNEVTAFIKNLYSDSIEEAASVPGHFDFKPGLQKLAQARFREEPVYSVVRDDGPPHRRVFEVEVTVKGRVLGSGTALRKKDAEQLAARQALERLKEEELPGEPGDAMERADK
jgi:ribonuclease-3